VPSEFERDVSMKSDCKSEAEIPRFREIFSKGPLETVEVSIINRAEFLIVQNFGQEQRNLQNHQ